MDTGSPVKVVIDFDDFCPAFVNGETWEMLRTLKKIYPDFKVTMFTIPWKCSGNWLSNVVYNYPWIEMALHGTNHKDPNEWEDVCTMNNLLTIYHRYEWAYVKGFKAPWWKISEKVYDRFRELGFWVATNIQNDFAGDYARLNYKYDAGDEIVPEMHYFGNGYGRWHGHIQPCYNGLPSRFEELCELWPKDTRFQFISEVVK